MNLEMLLAVAFGGAFLTYIAGKLSSWLRDTLSVLLTLVIVTMVSLLYGKAGEHSYMSFLGFNLSLRTDTLSWLFAIAVSVLGSLSAIFSLSYMKGKERLDFYYFMMLLINASMLGIVFAGDLISFYVFWEIMSWGTFLLISYNRGPALAAGLKYIIMSIAGSSAYLLGMFSLYASYSTFNIADIAARISTASSGYLLSILILFSITFGIKNALVPLHIWLPDAHSEAPSPFSAVLSGILIKMGTYGFVLSMYVLVGLKTLSHLGHGILSFHFILAILAAITILIPTFIALMQDDAKRVLAWSSIAQVGYIILGIAIGTSLGFAGGMFHFLNHASFKALLFMAVGAVEYRTGTRDLNSLGGIIKRMPLTFAVALIGALGLIGFPLTNGFVSKWLIYKTLVLGKDPFLAFVALFGTWGTILYAYKILHNIFMGQLPEDYKDVREAPFSMQLPMVILSIIVILFGILPGIPLKIINSIGVSFGFKSLAVNIWGIASDTGALNTINIFSAVLVSWVIVWLIFKAAPSSLRVEQDNNYAAGSYIPKEKYQYTANFYAPIYRIIKPCLVDVVEIFYMVAARAIRELCDWTRRIYTGELGSYVMYIMFFLVVLITIKLGFNIW